ncbi:MAG: HemK/PrmC family methyltransferase [Nocardioidaceae bacterium]
MFVPRPETEQLAEWGVATVSRAALPAPVVVDLCTGSGAIAAWIAHQVPGARVHAVELDEGAYAYAERNLAAFDVDLRLGDAMHAFPELDASVDLVLANPPYIPLSAWEGVEQEVRDWDPALALWSGEDGLDTIRVVEQVARRLLQAGGAVGCEHADAQRRRRRRCSLPPAAGRTYAITGTSPTGPASSPRCAAGHSRKSVADPSREQHVYHVCVVNPRLPQDIYRA